MKIPAFVCILMWLIAVPAHAQDQVSGMNPLIDPFAANTKTVLPPPLSFKGSGIAPPSMPPPPHAPAAILPASLRALLIRDKGVGLLGSADPDAASIPVTDGKLVRIGDQEYTAEVTASEIRLFATPKGKLLWQGTLGGPAQPIAPVDMSQLKYIPPLSAGVNPGLRSSGSPSASSESLIRKNGVQ